MGLLDRFRRRTQPIETAKPALEPAQSLTPGHAEVDKSPKTAPPPTEAPTSVGLKTGGAVSVSNEEHYQQALVALRGHSRHGTVVTAALALQADGNPWVKSSTGPVAEVKVSGSTVGFLTPRMTARYAHLIASAEDIGETLMCSATVIDGSGKSGRDIEIILDAIPLLRGQQSIAGTPIETEPEFVIDPRTGAAHDIKAEKDGAWSTECGVSIPGGAEVVHRTAPWVGRVDGSGTIVDVVPERCGKCDPDRSTQADVYQGGRFGDHTGIRTGDRFSVAMTDTAVESAIDTRLDFDVAGESFRDGYPENLYRLATVLETIDGPEFLACVLRRDPANAHDSNAIEIHVVGEIGHVGYVPGKLAAILAPLLDADQRINASAVEVRVHPDSPDRPGLTVSIQRS